MTTHAQRSTQGRGRLHDSVVDTISDTPCIPPEPAGADTRPPVREGGVL